jgi:hypothetical protein
MASSVSIQIRPGSILQKGQPGKGWITSFRGLKGLDGGEPARPDSRALNRDPGRISPPNQPAWQISRPKSSGPEQVATEAAK